MNNLFKKLSVVFAGGCLGGFTNSLVVWFFGLLGITTVLGVKIAPQLTVSWLYPRIVWGGFWGVLFLLPLMHNRHILKGLIYSLGPTLVQLLLVFPFQANQGMLGLGKGALTPLFVIIFNAVWGITAALWIKWADKSEYV
jgi:hypothetical protein